ncbi:MAG: type II toxin-antitoxin system VapC family toxin [Saprospiraceae bacterium]
MSGRKLLLDSNIVIYLAKKELAPEVFVLADDALYLSDVSFLETLGYAFSDEDKKQAIETLLSVLFRLSIEEVVVQKVVALRQTRRMKLPDAIIAATALVHDCVLVHTTGHFWNETFQV